MKTICRRYRRWSVSFALRYFEAADLPAIVRVPSKVYHHIARAMDMGAEGLMLPMVGIGISMSITSLIHYINRTPSQKLLLRASMTLVLFATAGAVLLPIILLALT